jgi:alanyl-tRNA synthetase
MRFDFNYPQAVSKTDLLKIEELVNQLIADEYPVRKTEKTLNQAKTEGATALFGEKYGQTVRTIEVADERGRVSYELCGGTHVDNTGEIGTFIILSEGSAAAGIRRIEAVTGRGAYEVIRSRNRILHRAARLTNSSIEEVVAKINGLQDEVEALRQQVSRVRQEWVKTEFEQKLENIPLVAGVPVLSVLLKGADVDSLRLMTDIFRQKNPSGVVAIGSVINDKPMIIVAVTEDLVKRGLNAGELVRQAAALVGGSGGGRPVLAQAGGRDADKLPEALASIVELVRQKLS